MNISIPEAFAPILESQKRYRISVGGRGSGKSICNATICLLEAMSGKRVLACREFQNSIAESSHSMISGLIDKLGATGFNVTRDRITHSSGGEIIYRGLSRNVESLKSLDGVSVVFLDEAQTISEESLRVLLPTIREPGSYFLMSANPRSQADPFTQRFFKMAEPLLRSGETFQDDLHTMVLVNIEDNPFAGPELMMERENDKKIMTSAQFAHVWQGHTLDDVENSLIDSDWFESALEIGDKINYRQSGSRVVGFDPSDVGRDASAVAIRHGARVLELALKHEGDVASSLDWSVDFVDRFHADSYIYDGDGIGLGIAREVERALGPRNVNVSAFRGGAGPENPSAMYNDFKTNKDAFNNRRSQAFWNLRERFIKTHQALDGGEYIDPDELIFLPKDHKLIGQLRSEICRLPIKPHPAGKLALMPKPEMARPPLSLPSPNLADSLAYAFSVQDFIQGSWSKPLEYTEAFI